MRLAITLLTCACFGFDVANAATSRWERIEADVGGTSFVAVAVHPLAPAHIVAATRRAVSESTDGGRTWGERFRAPGTAAVRGLAVARTQAVILVATDRGLYGSFDGGGRWTRVFRGRDEDEARCTVVAFHPLQESVVLLGTRGGLFLSTDDGRRWEPASLPHAARRVAHVAFSPDDPARVLLVADERLFIGDVVAGEWQERFDIRLGDEDTAQEPLEATGDAEEAFGENAEPAAASHRLTAVAIDPEAPQRIYLAGTRGVAVSPDGGIRWQWMTRVGLQSPVISRLLPRRRSPLVLYAATDRGVARYEPAQARWEVITAGLSSAPVHDLAVTPDRLWAATDTGLYHAPLVTDPFLGNEPPAPQALLANFAHEPTMAQVREAAIRYAEVAPEKIARWRRQAALRALFPTVDVGIDRDHSRTAHYDEGTFPKFQIVETNDRDSSLDLSITWELGDLLWNDDQTSIDVRSKLMVQLRNDIVDEVTRMYFERRRVQVALLTAPPEDPQEILEQELRLQELTALIDGLTGGYFSAQTTINGMRTDE
jgi:photosystem II stability/assembly factor-like uncharacterized protein